MVSRSDFVINDINMRKSSFMIWFMMLGLYFSCAGPGQTSRRGGYEVEYSEDLSALRRGEDYKLPEAAPDARPKGETPTRPGTVMASMDVTSRLEALLEESAEKNKEVKSIPGYTIQVYLGASRDAATKAQRQVYMAVADARPELRFVQPNWRVVVGKFVDRMEANQTFSAIKKEFPNALVIPDRIQINE